MDIKHWEEKIQQVKKQNTFTQFLKEIASRYPMIFYKHEGMVARYPQTDRIASIVSTQQFEKERDTFINHGKLYDSSRSFFDQLTALYRSIPMTNLYQLGENENVNYAHTIWNSKNVYLSWNITNTCENILYSFSVKEQCINIHNSFMTRKECQNIYSSSCVVTSFNIFYAKFIYNCSDIWFSSNLVGCHHCLFCQGLENKTYCIHNKQYAKEEYEVEKEKILQQKEQFFGRYKSLQVQSDNLASTDVDGHYIIESQNIQNGHFVYKVHEGRNIVLTGYGCGMERIYDTFISGAKSDYYGVMNCGAYSEHIYNSVLVTNSSHIHYSYELVGCSFCLGCVGLKNKQFCILNTQYTKEERYKMAEDIFQKMSDDGILGDFFPANMNPFYFNDTVAYLIDDSFTKEEVEQEGYLRRDEKIKVDIPEGAEIIQVSQLVDYQGFDGNGNWKINPEIMKKVIVDDQGNYYKIVKMEYDFLMKYGLPLPEIHWLDRIKLGFKFK